MGNYNEPDNLICNYKYTCIIDFIHNQQSIYL
jgi:hypothetical protein